MRWPILVSAGLLASAAAPPSARADDAPLSCTKLAPGAKLTIPFTPDLTLRDLGVWVAGFTCKGVVYDAEAAARATKLALIAPSSVTPKQAVALFTDTLKKAGLAVAERSDTFVVTLDPSAQRPCPPRGSGVRPGLGAGACARPAAGAKLAVSFAPEVTLDDLAVWVAGFTCKPVRFDPSIATQATKVGVVVPGTITARQATRLFAEAIEATGLTVAEKASSFEVAPGPRWAHCAAGAAQPPTAPAPGTPPAPTPAPADPADPAALDAALDAGIRKLDDRRYEVTRALLDRLLANPMDFAKSVRIVPSMKNGKAVGFKLFAIRPRSTFARIGLVNGDTLMGINGHALDSADKALEVYTHLKGAKEVVFAIERQGKPMTITIKIVK